MNKNLAKYLKSASFDFLTVFSFFIILLFGILSTLTLSPDLSMKFAELEAAQISGNNDLIGEAVLDMYPQIEKYILIIFLVSILCILIFSASFSYFQKLAWNKKTRFIKFFLFNSIWIFMSILLMFLQIFILPPVWSVNLLFFEILLLPYASSVLIRNFNEKHFWTSFKFSGFNIKNFAIYAIISFISSIIAFVIIAYSSVFAIIPFFAWLLFLIWEARFLVNT